MKDVFDLFIYLSFALVFFGFWRVFSDLKFLYEELMKILEIDSKMAIEYGERLKKLENKKTKKEGK